MACTFAYPYMNGRLHLGHGMVITKTDIAVRFRKMKGHNVLFPFGFHCTGMPIHSSAMKLRLGDDSVRSNLISMGITEDDIHLFEDPYHWVKVFPAMAMDDLSGMNLDVDFSRSFVTTDINPYYDSFIQWQFRHLFDQGKLSYDKRPCIYSRKDQQPCADHDRQTGEGVKPEAHLLFYVDRTFALATVNDPQNIKSHNGTDYYISLDKIYVGYVSEDLYYNMIYQGMNPEIIDEDSSVPVPVPVPVRTDPIGTIYLPAQKVISRSGDQCIVAIVPQWYIKYSDPVWKNQVREVISEMTIHDVDARRQLDIAVDNLDDWCVSRECGLGSRLPNDPKFLIDSLSDSTIYPAYYTVCHLLHSDLYGAEQLVPIEYVNDGFWDAVFLHKEYSGSLDITEFQRQFQTYYPSMLRVSGKDLIYNHLIMSIYNHLAILGKDSVCKEYLIYGHAKIDGQKMSKSTGNFITIADAKIKYPRIDALRVMLVEAGDGLEDANIRLSEYNNVCKALDQCEQGIMIVRAQSKNKLYVNMLMHCYHQSQQGFETGRFREALTYGWRKCEKIIKSYCSRTGMYPEPDVVNLGYIIQHITLSLITGSSVINNMPDWANDYVVDQELVKLYDLVQIIERDINKIFKKYSIKSVNVKLHRHMEQYEQHIKSNINDIVLNYDDTILHAKRDPFKIKPLVG
jgi:leucyl-tRNA synthetase